jgi:hypothetical protein
MLGFRGLGYSVEFVANMRAVVDAFLSVPSPIVAVVIEADSICRACPHLSGRACARGNLSEQKVRTKDEKVLMTLGLEPGCRIPAYDLLALVAERVEPRTLESLCTQCNWWPFGYCAEGLAELRGRRGRSGGGDG